MSAELAIILWLAFCIASAVVVSYLAHRWGRDPFAWVMLSAMMGPFALVGLLGVRQSDRARPARPRATGDHADGGPILIACDGSAVSARLGEEAAAYWDGREMVLLTVLPYEVERHGESGETLKRVEDMTQAVSTLLDERGIPSRTVVRYGPPGPAVVAFAVEVGASHIIMGRRGSGLKRAVLGSVSAHVAAHADVPVILVS
jgi:nucleotide-binding universal stress UspA family protein